MLNAARAQAQRPAASSTDRIAERNARPLPQRASRVRAVQEAPAVREVVLARLPFGNAHLRTQQAEAGQRRTQRGMGAVQREVAARQLEMPGRDVEELVGCEAVRRDAQGELEREGCEQKGRRGGLASPHRSVRTIAVA